MPARDCLFLKDFPGGFYDDMDATRDEFCDCDCHRPVDDDLDEADAPGGESTKEA